MAMVRAMKRPARRISQASRQKKLRILTEWIEPGSSVLLVGASGATGIGTESLVERGLAAHASVVALTYEPVEEGILGMQTVQGDARDLPFEDDSFDYVISNAVIEHVGGPDDAQAMIAESERVARRGWLHTTPNRRFPIELHTGVPVLHWLPERQREQAFRATGRTFTRDRVFLYTARSLRGLTSDAVVTKRATGFLPAMTLLVASPTFQASRVAWMPAVADQESVPPLRQDESPRPTPL